ncbi:hypothetical protein BS47DRAFT_1357477 [Hydnum rufescens UP504]|uniref:Uncharacterized protein n=1 Tax=Hydnum rufescens UP504 TaxID=1448309 RepID=A0A9P6BAU4_9AGAM|nr:hypothetical protein BS47DRAFT_1357477 [Hydnum rufescens UP504]
MEVTQPLMHPQMMMMTQIPHPPPIHNPTPPAPCQCCTEVKLLGPAQDLGKCIPKPSWKVCENLAAAKNSENQEDNTAQNNSVQCLSTSGLLNEPCTYHEAMNQPDAGKWEEAVQKELAAVDKMNVLQECALPPGQKAIRAWCVF